MSRYRSIDADPIPQRRLGIEQMAAILSSMGGR
jgi:hypothetical protein